MCSQTLVGGSNACAALFISCLIDFVCITHIHIFIEYTGAPVRMSKVKIKSMCAITVSGSKKKIKKIIIKFVNLYKMYITHK